MYSQAFSVPHAVRQVIGSNTLFFQALSTGIANYTALAQKIKPEVEKLTKSEVNINTLVVAIKRFADSLEDNNYEVHPILDGVRMTLTGSIIDIDFQESDDTYQVLDEIFELGGGYNIFRTNKQFRIFAEDMEEIRSMFKSSPKGVPGEIKDGLSKITITVQSKENTYEVLSMVLSILHNNRIPLYNAFFTQNEIVLILGMDDAAKAYEVVREKLYSHD